MEMHGENSRGRGEGGGGAGVKRQANAHPSGPQAVLYKIVL